MSRVGEMASKSRYLKPTKTPEQKKAEAFKLVLETLREGRDLSSVSTPSLAQSVVDILLSAGYLT